MAQITSRLAPELKTRFTAYAAGLGLKASELAKLLIIRELHRKRLVRAKLPEGSSRTGREMPKVTAHFSSPAKVRQFDAHARECGLNRGRAAAWVLGTELEERWLERMIGSD